MSGQASTTTGSAKVGSTPKNANEVAAACQVEQPAPVPVKDPAAAAVVAGPAVPVVQGTGKDTSAVVAAPNAASETLVKGPGDNTQPLPSPIIRADGTIDLGALGASLVNSPNGIPTRITGLELTEGAYLKLVSHGLWGQLQGDPNAGFQNNAAVAQATQQVQATPSVSTADLSAPADLSAFVRGIAEPTATATIGGTNQEYEKFIVFGRNAGGEVVVRAIALMGPNGGVVPSVQGRIGLAHVHYAGLNQPPHAGDDSATRRNVPSFVIGSTGQNVWEIGRVNTVNSIRSVLPNNQFGPWEQFQVNPDNYTIYNQGAP
jgi:hypothetical protein